MMMVVVRKARPNDIDDLTAIEKACFAIPWSRESLFHDLTENEMALYIIAEVDGVPAGYVGVWNIYDEGHINNVAVLPEYRRLHVGTLLVRTLIQITERQGIKSHTLEVRRSNQPAIQLYLQEGFREAGIRPGYYTDPDEDAIIMWRIGDPQDRKKES